MAEMRNRRFETVAELDTYVGGPKIQCLECGRWFKSLATHLPRIHGLGHDDYREKWGIPRRYALAGTATRETLSRQIRDQINNGRLDYSHLPNAVCAAREAPRPRKAPADDARHRQRVAEVRPGDHHRLPPGSRRSDGRDADHAREYQRARRRELAGEKGAMREFQIKRQADHLTKEFGRPEARPRIGTKELFSQNEKLFIAKHYPEYGPHVLSIVLGRSYRVVASYASANDIHHNSRWGDSHRFRWDSSTHDPVLRQMHAEGMTRKEIAEEIGTSVVTVCAHAKQLGLTRRRGRKPKRKSP
ncbi:MAG: MucR family transcriptional regulator [Pseudomonadota bacterium]